MIRYQIIIANIFLAVFLCYSQNTLADTFTSAKVLEWPEASQNSLFQSSITMIGIVATQRQDTSRIARCIDTWYGSDKALGNKRYDQIRAAMRRFPEYHPQAVILAVVEKACGKFES